LITTSIDISVAPKTIADMKKNQITYWRKCLCYTNDRGCSFHQTIYIYIYAHARYLQNPHTHVHNKLEGGFPELWECWFIRDDDELFTREEVRKLYTHWNLMRTRSGFEEDYWSTKYAIGYGGYSNKW
jgi:hypothetical protein